MPRQIADNKISKRTTETLAIARANIAVGGDETLLSTDQVAALLGRAVDTIRSWRTQRKGPAFFRHGARGPCLYRWANIRAWMDAHTIDNGGAS